MASSAAIAGNNNLEISNGYFSLIMPNETKNTYSAEKIENGIYISEKISAKSGLGGFAFGLKIFKSPKDYADNEDYKKIGELTDKKGNLYDMVLIKPRELYYGDGEVIAENFARLYDYADNVEIKGVNGSKYFKNQGTKGENLYGEVLKQYKSGIKKESSMNKIGYAYYDLNSDGTDELFIGKITKGKTKSTIYEVYTMVDRKPAHVVSGEKENRLFVCNDNLLWNEVSSSGRNSVSIDTLKRNSIKLDNYISFIHDTKSNKAKPWFISYGNNGNPENVSKIIFNETKSFYTDFKQFDFVPLSNLK